MPLPHPERSAREWRRLPVCFPATLRPAPHRPLIVEIGPGRGDLLFHLAHRHPHAVVAAIEVKPKRVEKLVRRIEKRGLENVFLIEGDARRLLPSLFSADSIDELHIHFPDPWPKKRHAKHRLITTEFLRECTGRLKPNGALFFTTDHERYAHESAALFAAIPGLRPALPERIVLDAPDVFPTFFAQKWRAEGRTIFSQTYRRI